MRVYLSKLVEVVGERLGTGLDPPYIFEVVWPIELSTSESNQYIFYYFTLCHMSIQ
jgi:hypothetical protein